MLLTGECRLGKVKGKKSSSAKMKTQKPKPGTVLTAGSKVNVTVKWRCFGAAGDRSFVRLGVLQRTDVFQVLSENGLARYAARRRQLLQF